MRVLWKVRRCDTVFHLTIPPVREKRRANKIVIERKGVSEGKIFSLEYLIYVRKNPFQAK